MNLNQVFGLGSHTSLSSSAGWEQGETQMKHPKLAPERWDQHSRCKGPETGVPGAPGEGVGRARFHSMGDKQGPLTVPRSRSM